MAAAADLDQPARLHEIHLAAAFPGRIVRQRADLLPERRQLSFGQLSVLGLQRAPDLSSTLLHQHVVGARLRPIKTLADVLEHRLSGLTIRAHAALLPLMTTRPSASQASTSPRRKRTHLL